MYLQLQYQTAVNAQGFSQVYTMYNGDQCANEAWMLNFKTIIPNTG